MTVLEVPRPSGARPRPRASFDRRRPREPVPVTPGLRRLSLYDLHCLRVETPARPTHLGILAVLDGRAICDSEGRLRLAEIRREIERRLADVPELRQVVFRPGRLAGRPLWIDDSAFQVDRHVDVVELRPPPDDARLLAVAERLMAPLLDRSRPLWRMWFVTGLPDGRVGVLVVLHHALADGMTAMRMVRSLLGPPLPFAVATPAEPWVPVAPPPWRVLVRDHVRTTIESVASLARPATWRMLAQFVRSARQSSSRAGLAPRASLNGPVGPRRRLAVLPIDLATAKRVARTHDCGVNDVVLDLVAGGLRALLDARGEPIERLEPRVGIAVARFSPAHERHAGNDIGTLVIPLPLGAPDLGSRLRLIAARRAHAKVVQQSAAEPTLRAWLGRVGVLRRAMEHQRLVNLAETYLPGPPAAIEVLGAPVVELLPIAPLSGNLGLSFVALSYAGRLTLTVRADADQFADLDVLSVAMERDWRMLSGAVASGDRVRVTA